MGRKNFQVEGGYWISRSVAVCAVVMMNGKLIAERRGPGCPDNIGKLVFPCGYIDFDEGLVECVKREIWEELGLEVKEEEVHFVNINADPDKDARQNITARFFVKIDEERPLGDINCETRGGEANEVSEIIKTNFEDMKPEEWAFNHYEIVKFILENQEAILNPKLQLVI